MRFTDQYQFGTGVNGEAYSPLEDSKNFLVIDRQLLGLFQIFGNGIVTGWDLSQSGGLAVSISPGRANVSFMSAETTTVRNVSGLVPNSTNYIFAEINETTRFDRDVDFISDTRLLTANGLVLLGSVTTNSSAIVTIDSSIREDISFIEQIKTLINEHRHRGGSQNPTKIDLASEVMGQLPGYHLEDLDASKVATGIILPERIPLLEHSDLQNSGILTHAQLDSFVRALSNQNTRLLGELSATNLLQLYLAMKHIWSEVDAYATNLLVMIPGISPDTFTDTENSTAVIDTTNHLIQGVPSIGGQLVTTTFRTALDFDSARLKSNIEIAETEDSVAYFKLTKPFTESIVESFDNVFSNDTEIPDWEIETIATENNTTFNSDSTKKVDGAYSVKFNVDQKIRVQATRVFDETLDWTQFNELEIYIQTLSAAHGKIILQTLKKNGSTLEEIDSFTVLDTNETTVGFRKITRDITNVTRDAVDAIRIYTDTSLGWDLTDFVVNIDRIRVNNNLFYNNSGRIRFRIKTPQKSHWAAISWDGDTNGGSIQARARSAPSYETFDQSSASSFSSFFSEAGGDPEVDDNRVVEVEVAIAASAGRTASPLVRSVTVSYITSSESSGLTVDTVDDFLRATKLENAAVQEPGEVVIDGRIDVGDVVYGMQHSIQQASISESINAFGTPIIGIDGTSLPISPLQASQNVLGLRESSLDGVASVERLSDRTYLAADALNDRVVIFDRDGNLVQGIASNNVRNQTDLYPLSVVYNDTTKILYISWSTNVSLATLDVSKMIISGAGLSITLSSSSDKVVRLVGPKTETQSSNVSPILLSSAHAGQIATFIGDSSVNDHRLFINIDASAAKEGINTDNENFATLVGPRGMPIFVGDIKFIQGLFRPVSVTITEAGNWLICNAKPLLTNPDKTDIITGADSSEITSVIEVDPETGEIVFSDNSVDFSLLTLGGAVEYNERYIAVAGIVEGEGPPETVKSKTVKATVGGGVVQTTNTTTTTTIEAPTQANAGNSSSTSSNVLTDVDVLNSRRGVIKIVEKASGRVVFEQETSDGTYAADIQLDEDNNLVSIEKSFDLDSTSGRIVKLDEDGNIFFQFGLAELSSPNDVRVLSTGNLVVST